MSTRRQLKAGRPRPCAFLMPSCPLLSTPLTHQSTHQRHSMCTTVIGAGVLALPYSTAVLGWCVGGGANNVGGLVHL